MLCTGEADREHMQLYTVAHIDALAVCNDGSPGAYYWRTGSNSTRCPCTHDSLLVFPIEHGARHSARTRSAGHTPDY